MMRYGWYLDGYDNVKDTGDDPFALIEKAVRARWEDAPDDMLLDMIRVGPLMPSADDPDDQICEGRPALPVEHDGDEWTWGLDGQAYTLNLECRAPRALIDASFFDEGGLKWKWWAWGQGQGPRIGPSSGTCATLADAMAEAEKVMRGE